VRTKKPSKNRAVRERQIHNSPAKTSGRIQGWSPLAQSDVGCDCQQQNPLFSNYKWKPGFVIEFRHCPLSKPSNHFYLYATMITEMGIEKQEKFPLSAASACG
jgi:hypothetical protein